MYSIMIVFHLTCASLSFLFAIRKNAASICLSQAKAKRCARRRWFAPGRQRRPGAEADTSENQSGSPGREQHNTPSRSWWLTKTSEQSVALLNQDGCKQWDGN